MRKGLTKLKKTNTAEDLKSFKTYVRSVFHHALPIPTSGLYNKLSRFVYLKHCNHFLLKPEPILHNSYALIAMEYLNVQPASDF